MDTMAGVSRPIKGSKVSEAPGAEAILDPPPSLSEGPWGPPLPPGKSVSWSKCAPPPGSPTPCTLPPSAVFRHPSQDPSRPTSASTLWITYNPDHFPGPLQLASVSLPTSSLPSQNYPPLLHYPPDSPQQACVPLTRNLPTCSLHYEFQFYLCFRGQLRRHFLPEVRLSHPLQPPSHPQVKRISSLNFLWLSGVLALFAFHSHHVRSAIKRFLQQSLTPFTLDPHRLPAGTRAQAALNAQLLRRPGEWARSPVVESKVSAPHTDKACLLDVILKRTSQNDILVYVEYVREPQKLSPMSWYIHIYLCNYTKKRKKEQHNSNCNTDIFIAAQKVPSA